MHRSFREINHHILKNVLIPFIGIQYRSLATQQRSCR